VSRAARGAQARQHPRGSALVLVLVMTLSLAGLALSAVLLTSSSTLVQKFYDKARDFRLYARAGIARTKSIVQRDTTVSIPADTAWQALSAEYIADATGDTNTVIKVNAWAAYTGDTAGTYIPYLTLFAQAYDTLGVRTVQRLDLRSESFSRYQMFVDTFLPNTSIPVGLHLRGRVHSNTVWASTSTSPGPDYWDTVSVVDTMTGTASYHGISPLTDAKRIAWPSDATLSSLAALAAAGDLSFAPVFSYTSSEARSGTNSVNISGENVSGSSARSGTRLTFKPVDVDGDGELDEEEGFFELFDLATGMDTANLRVDPAAATSENTRIYNQGSLGFTGNAIVMNQCGLLIRKANGRREFFPVARFRERWVRAYVLDSSAAPALSSADTAAMGGYSVTSGDSIPSNAAVEKVLGYGVGYSRCFPAGSPYLMLAERYVDASCTIDSTALNTPWGWGAAAVCGSGVQYGGQDTTFTVNATRCWMTGTAGKCSGTAGVNGLARLGSWRAFGGTSTANPSAAVLQAVETPYLWPISTTYNANSRGVIYSNSTSPLYVSDTLRGWATLYGHGRIVLIDDLVYDRDPTGPDALCRNMLGIVADTSIKVASSALNFYRRPSTGSVYKFLGTPNFNLHAIAMALSPTTATWSSSLVRRHGVVGVEDSSTTISSSVVVACNGINTLGGCFNHTGGAIMHVYHSTRGAANTGLVRNMTPDPCQAQEANRRPPFFPLTGRYVDYKRYDIDPQQASTWSQVKDYYARLRGNLRKVP
jgi:hypothetical protein